MTGRRNVNIQGKSWRLVNCETGKYDRPAPVPSSEPGLTVAAPEAAAAPGAFAGALPEPAAAFPAAAEL